MVIVCGILDRATHTKDKAAWKQHRYPETILPSSTAPNARSVSISA
jgi:hypothetical protein